MSGPLKGIKVIELGGIGPAPMTAMLLADLGASVLRVTRGGPARRPVKFDTLARNRPAIALDLKKPADVDLVLDLVEVADATVEGFRPGVAERLGIGPDQCFERNPKLVYGRMTGWGQTGPLAHVAGHDINYIALTGALHAIGRKDQPPVPPLNLIGDFGGGALYLAMGILSALLETGRSGKGQVVDAAMVDGAASLMTSYFGTLAAGAVSEERGTNPTDTGSYFYDVYECADGNYVAIGCIEPQFHKELFERLEIDTADLPAQMDKAGWPQISGLLAATFRSRAREEWCDLLEGTETCFAPVLRPSEAADHPHNAERQTFIEIDGVVQPAPAPRFSRTVPDRPSAPVSPADTPEEIARIAQAWANGT